MLSVHPLERFTPLFILGAKTNREKKAKKVIEIQSFIVVPRTEIKVKYETLGRLYIPFVFLGQEMNRDFPKGTDRQTAKN